jgi:hypothetical protein
MDQDHHRRICPAINAMHYHSVWFYLNQLRRRTGRAAAASEPLSTGRIEAASRHMRIASVYRVSAIST